MYSVTIRDHIMVAHSLGHSAFGKAAQLHGATYIVDVFFFSSSLNARNIVIDIGLASEILKGVLEKYRYQNLDELDEFKGRYTTTEFLAQHIHSLIKNKCRKVFRGKIRVTLGESHVAWASYED
jgi:6-pyruvoyltetrahydropterin/6-carboxytetrahydropterin synthase